MGLYSGGFQLLSEGYLRLRIGGLFWRDLPEFEKILLLCRNLFSSLLSFKFHGAKFCICNTFPSLATKAAKHFKCFTLV